MKRITLTPSAPNNNAGRLSHPNASSDTFEMRPSDAVCQKSSQRNNNGYHRRKRCKTAVEICRMNHPPKRKTQVDESNGNGPIIFLGRRWPLQNAFAVCVKAHVP